MMEERGKARPYKADLYPNKILQHEGNHGNKVQGFKSLKMHFRHVWKIKLQEPTKSSKRHSPDDREAPSCYPNSQEAEQWDH